MNWQPFMNSVYRLPIFFLLMCIVKVMGAAYGAV